MGRTNSPRYEAFTTTRFYPTMQGRNLTFAPSQYGDGSASGAASAPTAAPATGAAEGAGGAGGSLFSAIGQLVGGLGSQFIGYKLEQSALDRQSDRERKDKLSEARLATEQAKAQMIAASFQTPKEPSVLPYVIGGTVLLVGLGVGGYFLTRN
jgi:hypothetical protein